MWVAIWSSIPQIWQIRSDSVPHRQIRRYLVLLGVGSSPWNPNKVRVSTLHFWEFSNLGGSCLHSHSPKSSHRMATSARSFKPEWNQSRGNSPFSTFCIRMLALPTFSSKGRSLHNFIRAVKYYYLYNFVCDHYGTFLCLCEGFHHQFPNNPRDSSRIILWKCMHLHLR